MHSGTGFKFCKGGIDKERGDSDMRMDATVAGSDAPRRKMPRAVFVAAALAFGLLPGMRALAGEPDAPAAAGVQVSMIGPALRSSDLDRSIKFYEQGLGMRVLRTIKMGSTTEVILGFGGGIGQPVIMLYKDDAPGKSTAIEQIGRAHV